MASYYDLFDLIDKKDKQNKKDLDEQELNNLYKKPKKDKGVNVPHFSNVYDKDFEHQADLLFMPTDRGYKYILVVTDIATRLSDAEPLKSKKSEEVHTAFKKIYKRNILNMPEYIKLDSGTEFQKDVKKWLLQNKVAVKYGKPGRSRQLAVVERTNQYIARNLFKRMQAQEILTGRKSVEWIDDLKRLIELINEKRKRDPPKVKYDAVCSGDSCNLLEIGTRVRPILDKPKDYLTGQRLHGKFRITDIRFDPIIRVIKNIMLLPGRPALYQLNNIDKPSIIDNSVAYTKNQLHVVPKNEQAPDPKKVLRGKPDTYVVKKILDTKKEKGRIYYKILWKGYPESEATWESRMNLIKDVPLLIYNFENNK